MKLHRIIPLAKAGTPLAYNLWSHYHRGIRQPLNVAIIDATFACNLNCTVCYYRRQKIFQSLTLEEWRPKLLALKQKGISFVTWTGGEPLLNRSLIEMGRTIFPFNTVFTNGTQGIPDWPDTVFYISIDGTEKFYRRIRGPHYQKIKSNIKSSPQPVNIAMVITRQNAPCLEAFVLEWSKIESIKGVAFSLYTPGKDNDLQGIPDQQIEPIITRLLKLKKKYPHIILSTNTLKTFLSQNRSKAIGSNCLVRQFTCLDASGNLKTPCSMAASDCEHCGQFTPFMFASMASGDLKQISLFAKHSLRH